MSLVQLSNVCSHLQNASLARLGLTSIPYTRLHLLLAVELQKQGFFSTVVLGGAAPPAKLLPARDEADAPSRLRATKNFRRARAEHEQRVKELSRRIAERIREENTVTHAKFEQESGAVLRRLTGSAVSPKDTWAGRKPAAWVRNFNTAEAEAAKGESRWSAEWRELEEEYFQYLKHDFLAQIENDNAITQARTSLDQRILQARQKLRDAAGRGLESAETQAARTEHNALVTQKREAIGLADEMESMSIAQLEAERDSGPVPQLPPLWLQPYLAKTFVLSDLELQERVEAELQLRMSETNPPPHPSEVEVFTDELFPADSVRKGDEQFLKREAFTEVEGVTQRNRASRRLWLGLKYWDGEPVLRKAKMLSKPTQKLWLSHADISKIIRGKRANYINGLTKIGECLFVSTDKGIMEARECEERRIGGMALCRVWG